MVSKRNADPDQTYRSYYCDVEGCDQKAVKVMTLRSRGILAKIAWPDMFDLCWKHYLESIQLFRDVVLSMKK